LNDGVEQVAARAGGAVEGVVVGGQLVLVGEGEQLDQVRVVELPVQLGAPEAGARAAVEEARAAVVGEAGVVAAGFVHAEEEQMVLHQRARRVQVEAAAVEFVVARDAVDVVALFGLEGVGLPHQFGAVLEVVAARLGHRIDHAAGGTAEFDRVTAGLDLEFLEERERHRRETDAVVEVGDVEAVDVDRVFRDGRAAEGHAVELTAHHARCQHRHAERVARDRQAFDFGGRDVRGRLGGGQVDDRAALPDHGDRVERRGGRTAQIHRGRVAQADVRRHRRTDRLAVLARLDGVRADGQERETIVAVGVGDHRALEAGLRAADGDRRPRVDVADQRAVRVGCVRHRHRGGECDAQCHPQRSPVQHFLLRDRTFHFPSERTCQVKS
jgi:hypothetical protein